MNEHDDEYLWSGQGTREDVAALERSLAPLRWRPQPLALPSEVAKLDDARQRRGANWWPAVAAGLVAAAAVLALLLWPRGDAAVGDPGPTVNPVAPPTSVDSPDLKDPFGPREPAGVPAPNSELEADPDPEVARSVSPDLVDLVDPFAGRSDAPARREPKPRSPFDSSADLKNPFKKSQPERDRDDELVDPFADRDDPATDSSDLKDPFSR